MSDSSTYFGGEPLKYHTGDKKKAGSWVKRRNSYYYWIECSECESRPPKNEWDNEWLSAYCPNCGAKMIPYDNEDTNDD